MAPPRPRPHERHTRPPERQRHWDALLLSRVFAHAQRVRQQQNPRTTGVSQKKPQHMTADARPLTLRELVAASEPVLAAHGIHAPADARFHRLLFDLSLDPERDWKKKLQRMAMGAMVGVASASSHQQGRVVEPRRRVHRLCQAGQSHRGGRGSSVSDRDHDDDDAQEDAPQRVRAQGFQRTRGGLAHSLATTSADAEAEAATATATATTVGGVNHEHRRAAVDRFQDALVSPSPSPSPSRVHWYHHRADGHTKEEQLRPSTGSESVRSPWDSSSLAVSSEPSSLSSRPWPVNDRCTTDTDEGEDSQPLPPMAAIRPRHQQPVFPVKPASPSLRRVRQVMFADETPHERRTMVTDESTHVLRSIATAFQQWREMLALRQIVRLNHERQHRLLQSLLPPVGAWAMFRWIACSLPDREVKGLQLAMASEREDMVLLHAPPRFVTRRLDVVHSGMALRGIVHALHRWLTRRIFQSWAMHTRCILRLRTGSLVRRRTEEIQFAVDCLDLWSKWAAREGFLTKTITGVVRLRLSSRCLRDSWRTWRVLATASLQARSLTARAIRQYRHHLLARTLHAWKQAHGRVVADAEVCKRFLARGKRRTLRSVLLTWWGYTQERQAWRTVVQEAQRRQDSRVLLLVLEAWKLAWSRAHADEEKRIKALASATRLRIWRRWMRSTRIHMVCRAFSVHYKHWIVREVFRGWNEFQVQHQRRGVIIRVVQAQKKRTLCSIVMKALVEIVSRHHQVRSEVLGYMHTRALGHQQACWNVWKMWCLRKFHRRDRDTKRVCAIENKTLTRSWRRWRRVFFIQTMATRIVTTDHNRWRRRCFAHWKIYTKQRYDCHHSIIRAQSALLLLRGRFAIGKWIHRMTSRRDRAIRSSAVQCLTSQHRMQQAWQQWRWRHAIAIQQHTRVAHAVMVWSHRLLFARFSLWKAKWLSRKQTRQILVTLAEQGVEKAMGSGFHKWRAYVVKRKKNQRHDLVICSRLQRFRLTHSVTQWRAVVLHQHRLSRLLRHCMTSWTTKQCSLMFGRWHQYVLDRRGDRHRQAVATECWQHRLLVQLFVRWSDWLALKTDTKHKEQATRSGIQRHVLHRSVRRLHIYAARRRSMARIHHAVVRFTQYGHLSAVWHRWRLFIRMQGDARNAYATVKNRMQVYRHRRAVQRWLRWHRVRALLRTTFLRIESRSSTSCVQQVFREWKRVHQRRVTFRALQQRALVFRALCLLPSAFAEWKGFVTKSQCKRSAMAHAASLLCHHQERRAFVTWRVYTQFATRLRHVMARRQQRLLWRCVHRWRRQFVVMQQQSRLNVESAHNCYTTTLTMRTIRDWHFTTRCQRLLCHAMQQWRLRQLARCVKAWTTYFRAMHRMREILTRSQVTSLSTVFNAWRAIVEHHVKAVQSLQLRVVARWLDAELRARFQRWRCLATQTRTIRVMLGLKRHTSLRYVWSLWREWMCQNEASRMIRRQRGRGLVRSYWDKWMNRHRLSVRVAVMRHRSIARGRLEITQEAWAAWRAVVAASNTMQQRFHQAQHGVHHSFLLGWLVNRIQERLDLFEALDASVSRPRRRRILGTVWAQWVALRRRQLSMRDGIDQMRRSLANSETSLTRDWLMAAVYRWRNVTASQALDQWRARAGYIKWKRVMMTQVLHKWHHALVGRIWRQWNAWRESQVLRRLVLHSGIHQRVKRMWGQWRNVVTSRQRRQFIYRHFTRFTDRYALRLALHTWTQATTISTQRRMTQGIAHRTLTTRALSLAVAAWHANAVFQRVHRVQLTVARVHLNTRQLVHYWRLWAAHVARVRRVRAQLQQSTERLQVLLLCTCFRGWVAWVRRRLTLQRVLELFTQRCSTHRLRRVLMAWRRYSTEKQDRRANTEAFFLTAAQRRGVRALRNHHKARSQERNQMKHALRLLVCITSERRRSVFLHWRARAKHWKRKRLATYRFKQERLLPKCWHTWYLWTCHARGRRQRVCHAVNMWKARSIRRCWLTWAWYHGTYRREKKATMLLASEHCLVQGLRRAVTIWHTGTKQAKRRAVSVRAVLMRWRLLRVMQSMNAWQVYTLHCRRLRATEMEVRIRHQRDGIISRVWCRWRHMHLVVRIGDRCRCRCVWNKWHAVTTDRRRWRHSQQTVQLVLDVLRQRRSIREWRASVIQSKLLATMSALSTRCWQSQLSARIFAQWLRGTYRQRAAKLAEARARSHFHGHLQRLYWRSWRSFIAQRRHTCEKQRAALKRWTSCSLRTWFTAWHDVVVIHTARHRLLARAVHMMRHAVQHGMFSRWRNVTQRQRQLRANLAALLGKRAQLDTTRVLVAWHQVASAMYLHRVHVYRVMARRWRQLVVLNKVERMMGASHERRLEHCLVAWRKRVALLRSVQACQRSAIQRDHQRVLREVVTAWRLHSRIRTRCRVLFASVASGNRTRFRFALWKQFTDQCQRMKRILAHPDTSVNALDGDMTTPLLTKKARLFQRWVLDWQLLETPWRRWRHFFHARLFFRMRRQWAVFTSWARWGQRQRCLRTTMALLIRQRRAGTLSQLFHGWHRIVVAVMDRQRQRRRERELWEIASNALQRRERQVLQRHWSVWCGLVDQCRLLTHSLAAYQRARVLTKHWLLWQHDVVPSQRMKRIRAESVASQMARWHLTRSMRKWNRMYIHTRRLRKTLWLWRTNRCERRLSDVMTRWRRYVHFRRIGRQLLDQRQMRYERMVFRTWTNRWWRARQLQCEVVARMARREDRCCRLMFLRWRAHVEMRRQSDERWRCALQFRLKSCLRRRWHMFAVSRVRQREMVQLATAWRHRRSVRCAITRWRGKLRTAQLCVKAHGLVQKKAFERWQRHVKEALAVRFARLVQQRFMQRIVTVWRNVARQRALWRGVIGTHSQERGNRCLREVWRRWRHYVEHAEWKRMARAHAVWRVLVHYFWHWRQTAIRHQEEREAFMQVATRHHCRVTKRMVFQRLQNAVQKCVQDRAVLLSVTVKLLLLSNHRLLEVIWREWHGMVHRRQRSEDARFKWQQRNVHHAVRSWRDWAASRQRHGQRLQEALQYRHHYLKRLVFHRWQDYVVAWKEISVEGGGNSGRAAKVQPLEVEMPLFAVTHDGSPDHGGPVITSSVNSSPSSSRRPMSPIRKRFRDKAKPVDCHTIPGTAQPMEDREPTLTLVDAATLSLDVKKRLLLLGQWKPSMTR